MIFFSQIGFANVQIIEPHLFFLRIWRKLRTVARTLVLIPISSKSVENGGSSGRLKISKWLTQSPLFEYLISFQNFYNYTAYNMTASITVHLQIFKLPKLLYLIDFDQTYIKTYSFTSSIQLYIKRFYIAVPLKHFTNLQKCKTFMIS